MLTRSPSGGRRGSLPRVLTRPPYSSEDAGQDAIDLAASVGLYLDPWQELVVRVALAERADGKYAAREVGFLVARQNGKGGALEAIALHGMFLVGDPLTLWTAHQTKTAFEAFLRLRGWIEGSPDLSRLVSRVNAAHGDEGFTLKSGARLRFLARSKSSGRGFSPQRIIFDEAQELSKLAIEAMLPSMRAQPNRQAIYTGTVPGPEINNPEHWTRLRDRGRTGGEAAGRLAWLEWTPDGSDDPATAAALDLSSRKAWRAANPSLGADRPTALALESLEGDYEALDRDSFARECLSVWPTLGAAGPAVFGPGKWESCAVSPQAPTPAAIGVAVSIDRAWASIGAASSDSVPHLGSVKRERGVDWLPAEVKRLQAEYDLDVVVADRGPAATLIPTLEAAGVAVTVAKSDDYASACADLFDAVQAGAVTHGSYTDLDAAVSDATTKPLGDRWAWARKAGDVSMLEAVTLAHWAAGNAAANPSVYVF